MRKLVIRAALCFGVSLFATAARCQETATYTYDALGRLRRVVHSGSINNGLVQSYELDAADNRTRVTVTGAGSRVIVVPLFGASVLAIK